MATYHTRKYGGLGGGVAMVRPALDGSLFSHCCGVACA